MKYINIMNIHSKKRFLKKFMKNLVDKNKEFIKKKYRLKKLFGQL